MPARLVELSGLDRYLAAMTSRASSHRVRLAIAAMIAAVALLAAACGDSGSSDGDLPELSNVPGSENAAAGGEEAADFSVMTLDGAGFTLSEHLEDDGRPVFLNMWASWCPPCKAEMPDINAASEAHEEVKFVGVSINDDSAAAADFAVETGIRYTIGFDEDGAVSAAYQVRGLPASYIISSDGVILERVFGAITEAEIEATLTTWFS